MATDPVVIPLALAVKLASLAVHADELLSPAGHEFDRAALAGLLQDPEVAAFVEALEAAGLTPRRRPA